MRKLIIALASLAVLLTGCYKDEVNTLLDQVDRIDGVTIPKMEKQISDMDASVKSIQAADAEIQKAISKIQTEYLPKIDAATTDIGTLKTDVKTLMDKEVALSKKVEELQKFVNEEAATKEWVEGTFATLEQQAKIQDALSEVNTAITSINSTLESLKAADEENLKIVREEMAQLSKDLQDKIKSTEESIKSWVNEKLTAYYTAAKTNEIIDSLASVINAKLNTLSEATSDNTQAISENAQAISDNVKAIKVLGDSLVRVKNEVTEGYKQAIEEAITKAGGEISGVIGQKISELNQKLDNAVSEINGKISALELRVQALEQEVLAINNKINTIDGQIKAIDSTILVLKETDRLIKETIASNHTLTQKQVDSLKDADAALLSKIGELTTYVNDTLKGTQDWAKATFATLAQHDKLQKIVSDLKLVVISIENDVTNLKSSVISLESNLKTWVNQQLQIQYDELNGKINALRTELMGYDSALRTELLGEISSAKQELTVAITTAITEALGADGVITAAINAKFNELSTTVRENFNTLKGLIDQLRLDVNTNTANINTINGQIAAINKTIEKLDSAYKAADGKVKEELNIVITNLRNYVGQLPQGVAQTNVVDWANATFATLEQQTKTVGNLQKISTTLDSLSRAFEAEKGVVNGKIAALKTSVDTCSANVRTWVSQTLTGYATLGAVDTKIQNFADGPLKTTLSNEIGKAKTEITAAYKQYITDALTNGGEIDAAIKAAVKVVNDKIEGTNGILERLGTAETNITSLRSDLTALETAVGTTPAGKTVNGLIDDLEAEVARIKGTYTGTLQGLDTRITTLEGAINGATGLIQKVTAIEGKLEGVSTTVKALIDNTIATEIAKVKGDGATKTIKQLEDAIAAINESLTKTGGILARLTEAEGNITTLQTNLGNLSDDVGTTPEGKTVNGLITELQTALTNLKAGSTSTIDDLDKKIEEIEGKLSTLQTQVSDLISGKLITAIQSISFVPKYTDGMATLDVAADKQSATATFTYIVRPAKLVDTLKKFINSEVVMKAINPLTRATSMETLTITDFTIDDAASGEFTVKAKTTNPTVVRNLAIGATAALYVGHGAYQYVSDFVKVKWVDMIANQKVSLNLVDSEGDYISLINIISVGDKAYPEVDYFTEDGSTITPSFPEYSLTVFGTAASDLSWDSATKTITVNSVTHAALTEQGVKGYYAKASVKIVTDEGAKGAESYLYYRPVYVEELEITGDWTSRDNRIKRGQSLNLGVNFKPTNATIVDASKITWSVNDNSKASITASGVLTIKTDAKVTGTNVGDVKVTATYNYDIATAYARSVSKTNTIYYKKQ